MGCNWGINFGFHFHPKNPRNFIVVSPGVQTAFKLSLWLRTNGWIFMPFSIHIPGMARINLVKFQATIRRFRRILTNFRPKSVFFSSTENSAKILKKKPLKLAFKNKLL